ncbi:MAG: hypothetical protein EA377_05070 [Phycisphaerales bacterium]|nr:MAG: hypothetical protein EA377_05070 [Phycisphaerales bacterium]
MSDKIASLSELVRRSADARASVPPFPTDAARITFLFYDSRMTRFNPGYQVDRPTGHCAATGETLEPGSICMATLCEREDDEGFDRFDYSMSAWERGDRPPRLFSYWRVTVPDPQAKKPLFVDEEVLLDLFQRLADDERPQRVAFRFVLGLILIRKKHLKLAGRKPATADGEHERWLVRPRGVDPDQPALEMVDPRLSEDDIEDITSQLNEILNAEL